MQLRFWENPFNEGRKIKKAAKCPHHYIKVVEVLGDCHHSGSESGKRERKKEAKARCHANMHLKNRVPSTVEFVCL